MRTDRRGFLAVLATLPVVGGLFREIDPPLMRSIQLAWHEGKLVEIPLNGGVPPGWDWRLVIGLEDELRRTRGEPGEPMSRWRGGTMKVKRIATRPYVEFPEGRNFEWQDFPGRKRALEWLSGGKWREEDEALWLNPATVNKSFKWAGEI
jgi:hypothetical protein